MGLNNQYYSAIDYMLETILLVNYLLFIIYYLSNILDGSGSLNLLLNSENNNYTIYSHFTSLIINEEKEKCMDIQSAENCKGFSETIRQLSVVSYRKARNNLFLTLVSRNNRWRRKF